MTVYRADMMLFVLQGFFSAFIVEMVLQLLFTSASSGLATFHDRRASVWRFVAINSGVTIGMIGVGALLAVTAHVLVLTRLAATIRVAVGGASRFSLITSVPFLTTAGAFVLLATSQGILWDLQQTGWDLPRYIFAAWDRLTVHAAALVTLCGAIVSLFLLKSRGFALILALGLLPAVITLSVGYLLYGRD
jgi:hypothetical protein